MTLDVAAQDPFGAFELRKIIARENFRGAIAARGADDARALITSHLDVNLLGREVRDREVEHQELVLGRHPRHLDEDIGKATIARMTRLGNELRRDDRSSASVASAVSGDEGVPEVHGTGSARRDSTPINTGGKTSSMTINKDKERMRPVLPPRSR